MRRGWIRIGDFKIDGFKIGGRMAAAIEGSKDALKRDAEATAYFFDAAGAPKPLGATLTNPPYAAVLKAMASQGADALYTGKIAEEKLIKLIRDHFQLTPRGMIEMLDLRRPIYQKTAAYGHFGREDEGLPWENTDKAEALKKAAK